MMNNYEGAIVSIDGLRIVRARHDVIPRLSLDVPAGQVVGLLGPSGSGKSTLLRAIVGVQIVKSGTVTVLGHAAGSPALRAEVGYVTQSPSIYGDLTVRDNISYFGRAVGLRGGELRHAVERTLDEVDLRPFAGQRVSSLSGGQGSRVSLAGALVGRPTLLVLDEPTVGLDPVLRRDLWNLFARLVTEGHSLIVSSHVMDEAARCDRLVLLREGEVLSDCTPDELLARTGAPDADAAFLHLIDAADDHDRIAS